MKKTKSKPKKYASFYTKNKTVIFGALSFGVVGAFIGFMAFAQTPISETSKLAGIAPSIDTSYTVPKPASGGVTLYVGGTGSNTYQTLKGALGASKPGDVIVVRKKADGSAYREGKLSLNKKVTIIGNPGDQVWFDGTTDITTGHQSSKWVLRSDGNYELPWYTPDFCSGVDKPSMYYDASGANLSTTSNGVPTKDVEPCAHTDMSLDPASPMAWDPQALYLNSTTVLQQVGSASGVNSNNKFYYQRNGQNSKLVINSLPNTSNKIEASYFPSFMILHEGVADGSLIKGIGFRRYATSEGEKGNFNGVFYVNASSTKFENIALWQNSGSGMRTNNSAANVSIVRSIFKENGYNGLNSNVSPYLTFSQNIVVLNNSENFGLNCGVSCGHGGVKMAHMDRATIKENLFEGNNGHGYWCDLSCDGVTIVNNITQSNTKSGIFYEVSTNGIIASNLLIDDAQGIRNAGPNTKIFNNTILSKGSGIYLQQDKRLGTSGFPAKYSNVIVSNNLTKTTIQIDPADKLPTSAYSLSGNLSSINPSSYLVNATNYYRTGNFTVKSGTNAYRTVAMIPNDVISAVGIPNIPPFNKGALTWFVPPAFTKSLNSAPTVPSNLSMSAINDTSATITWSKSTDSENDQFTYTIKNGASVLANNISSSSTSYTLTKLVPSTQYAISIEAIDSKSAVSQASTITFTTKVDSTKPSVSITYPAIGNKLTGIIPLKVSANDNFKLSSIEIYVFGNPTAVAKIVDFGGKDTTVVNEYVVNWDSSKSLNGGRILYAIAIDSSGNKTQSENVSVTLAN